MQSQCTEPSLLSVKQANLTYARQLIFADLDFEVARGEWLAIMGPSGVGKTSLLRLIAGLSHGRPQGDTKISGTVLLNSSASFQVAYMAQSDALLPWRSALENVCLPFDLHSSVNKQAKRKEALALLKQVKLAKYQHFKPAALSGGMKQRVALARTLIQHHDLILMDEPFSALDAMTRMEMQALTYQILRAEQKTVLLVTHDPWEALRLADRVMILSGQPAKISQYINLAPTNRIRDVTNPDLLTAYQELMSALGVNGFHSSQT